MQQQHSSPNSALHALFAVRGQENMGFGKSQDLAQVTNIAPTATNEQLRTLLAFVGTIREFAVYPSNDSSQQMARVCYVRYVDPMSVCVAQHLTNTVFIDRAIFVKPVTDGRIPDEALALKLANEGHSQNSSNSGVVSQIANVNGTQSITTIDPRLNALGLPQYPPLPANLDPSKIEEIRRTVTVVNVSQYTTPEEILKFFNQFGEVKYLRMTSNDGDIIKSALIEFTDQSSVANALQSTGTTLNGAQLSINHSTTSILKSQHSLNDTNEKFYDPKSRSKDSPIIPSRSRSQSRRSRSPHRPRRRSVSRSRSPPPERRQQSRSRDRRRSVERRRSRSPSYSKDRNRDRNRRVRERSKERDRKRSVERGRDRERRRSRDRERRRDHSRERRSKERDRESRNRRKDRERSRDSDRRGDKHRSRRDKERRHSRSRSDSKNASEKRGNPELPVEDLKLVKMEIDDDKKNEPDSLSMKSEEGSSSPKSSSPWLSPPRKGGAHTAETAEKREKA